MIAVLVWVRFSYSLSLTLEHTHSFVQLLFKLEHGTARGHGLLIYAESKNDLEQNKKHTRTYTKRNRFKILLLYCFLYCTEKEQNRGI